MFMLLVFTTQTLMLHISQFVDGLTHFHNSLLRETASTTVLLGDVNVNLLEENTEQKAHKKFLMTDKNTLS